MKRVLFLSFCNYKTIEEKDIYTDLLREFRRNGWYVYIVSPIEKKKGIKSFVIKEDNCEILQVQVGDYFNVNSIRKGLTLLTIDGIILKTIKTELANIKIDLVLYATPPIMFIKSITYLKNKGATTYLMLKDIFPQNAVDIGMLSKSGLRGIIYQYFRYKEKKLYALSDHIGCMSQANVDYVIKHNPDVNSEKVEICPNSIEPIDMSVNNERRVSIRKRYGIPLYKKVFVYGGNLGKPQGIPFLIECLKAAKDTGAFFLIVGDGTEYGKLEAYVKDERPAHVKLMQRLPKDDYDAMVGSCDVGMIFLDHRFTIPNFPSRLLSYMQAKLPVLAVTDPNTDIGKVIVDGGFGWWCESNDTCSFIENISKIIHSDIVRYGNKGFSFLKDRYSVRDCTELVLKKCCL